MAYQFSPSSLILLKDCPRCFWPEHDMECQKNHWAEGSFIESVSLKEMKQKEHAIYMKHNEEMDYNCKQCNVKISAHNKDWHAGLCSKCFDKMGGFQKGVILIKH